MLSQFRAQYPQGSLTSELIQIDHGRYIVRALVVVDGVMLASGLAADQSLEAAEDQARLRALALLNLENASTRTESAAAQLKANAVQSLPEPELQPLTPAPPAVPPSPPASVASVSSPEPLPTQEEGEKPEKDSIPAVAKVAQVEEIAPETEALPLTSIAVSAPSHSIAPKSEAIQAEEEALPLPLPNPAPPTTSPTPLLTFIPEPESSSVPSPAVPVLEEPIDFSEVIARSNVELKRLGWTSDQGRNYLLQTYGKRSRQLLSDEELLEFLQYLESQPTPS